MTYTDQENNPPSLIRIGIDGTNDAPAMVLNLSPDNPGNPDQVYTDGAIYKTDPIKLAEGQHIIRAQASDGTGRYPNSLPGQPFLFAGPPSDSNDPNSTPLDSVNGPLVTSNTPPTLSFEAVDNGSDPTNPPGLDPNTGRQTTTFTYRVIYTDTDRFAGVAGNPPEYVRVFIDGTQNDMTKVTATDNDYTDGAVFQFTISGLQEAMPHRYWFVASDGLDRARLPRVGVTPSYYNGPIVDEPPSPPLSLVAQDHPNDNGGVIDLTFNASQDDGGGSNDVTEYRVYRGTSSRNYPTTPVATLAANGQPTYSLEDRTAVTGVDYFYIVVAWDGANESDPTLSNEEGPVKAIDNISPQPPANVTVTDPGLGGTLRVAWNLSPDDGGGQNDVKEYHIYRATTATGFAPPFVATVAAGVSSYDDTGVTDGTDYWYMVRAFDGANESVDSNVAGPGQSTDQQPPVISGISPANRAMDVPRDTNITFIVSDNGRGVDASQVTMQVNGADVTASLTRTGSPARYNFTYDPPVDFDFREVVSVDVSAKDFGGQSATRSWRFTVAGEPTYTISGTITDSNGVPLANVVVSAGALSGTSDSVGNYTITGLVNGNYTVKPRLRGYAFTPMEQSVTINDASVTGVDFLWQVAYDMRGRVVDDNGDGMQGVTLTDGLHTVVTNSGGYFVILDAPAGSYNLTPSLSRYVFAPRSLAVTLPPTATGLRFVGTLETFGVTGVITDLNGKRLPAVTVTAADGGPDVEAITNDSGQYNLTGLLPGRWTLTPRKAEYIFRPVSQTVDIDANMTEVNFVGVPVYSLDLPAGISFLALPILPEATSPLAVFGVNAAIYRYDPSITGYRSGADNATMEFMQVKPGRGFWVGTPVGTVLNVAGTPQPNNQTTSLQLLDGWNMAGNPYSASLPWANVGVTEGGPVRDFAYIYDRNTNDYILVSDTPGTGGVNAIPQNSAMWMRAIGTRTVLVSPVSTTAAARHEAWTRGEGEFAIPIVAAAPGSRDTTARAGVVTYAASHPQAYEIENPPAQSGSVDVFFPTQDGRRMTVDIRGASANTLTYNFTVKTDLQNVPVKVTLPDLSQVPREKAVILTDVASGKRLWARTLNNYTYNSGTGGERQFRLELVPNLGGGLSVAITPAAVRASGTAISYTLSRAASVQITILNLGGRTVRVLARDKSAQPGLNSEAWDLRNEAGAKVPAGRYLVRVQAAADDGQQVTAVAPLMVQ